MTDPKRLLDQAEGFERHLLESARDDIPSAQARAAAERAAQGALSSGTAAPTGLGTAKWIIGAAVAGALAVGVWSVGANDSSPTPVVSTPEPVRASPSEPGQPPDEAPIAAPTDLPSEPEPEPTPAPRPVEMPPARHEHAVEPSTERSIVEPAPPPESTSEAQPPKPEPTLGEEIALLDRARAALEDEALESVEQALSTHASRFANGALRPEAMLLGVRLALARKDRPKAETLAEALRSEFPTSPLLTKLDRLLAD